MKECSAFYIKRKLGEKQSFGYILSAYLPTLLIFIVFALLSFITVFMHSMGRQTNELVEALGSGSILVYDEYQSDEYTVDRVKNSQALGYGKEDTLLLRLKGVEQKYFNDRRSPLLKMEGELPSGRNIILSKVQADKLKLKLGDRIVLALYESDKDRIRPVNCTITGLYLSGYGEFDDNLAFVPHSLLEGNDTFEILLDKGEDNQKLYQTLIKDGYRATTYQNLYKDLLDNILLSINLIRIIVILIAFVAGFFALNIATEYISRDKKEIKSLFLMGYSNKEIGKIYIYLSFVVTQISAFFGSLFGIALVYLSSFILKSLNPIKYPVLANYVTNFDVLIPYKELILLFLALIVVSYTALYFSLCQFGKGRKVLL